MRFPFVLKTTHESKVKELQLEISGLSHEVGKWADANLEIDCKYFKAKADLVALGHEKGRLESINASLESRVTSLEHGFAIERAELNGTLMVKDDDIAQLVDHVKKLQKYNHDLLKIGMKLEADVTKAKAPKTRKRKTAAC